MEARCGTNTDGSRNAGGAAGRAARSGGEAEEVGSGAGPAGDHVDLDAADGVIRERDMQLGQRYPVVFRRIENQQSLTGAQINAKTLELKAIQFGRVEDLDDRKGGAGREVYFNVTGQDNTGANADYSRSKFGRVYRLALDEADPTRGDGGAAPGRRRPERAGEDLPEPGQHPGDAQLRVHPGGPQRL